ncbi:HEAT repeat domain-containing protein [Lacicoccus alkaliphilus]
MEIVWTIIFALTLLLTLLVGLTIWRAVHREKRREAMDGYIEAHFDEWFAHLYYGAEAPEYDGSRRKRMAIERVFSTFLYNGYSAEIKKRISEYARKNLSEGYGRDLKSPLWAHRVNALNRISEFEVPGFADFHSRRRLARMTRSEYFRYLIYLSHFDMNAFRTKFLSGKDLSEYDYKKIFTRLDDDKIFNIQSLYRVMPDSGRYAYIDRVSRTATLRAGRWLESLLKDDDAEVRIRVLKAVQERRIVEAPGHLMQFFNSDVWEERMLVCRLAPYIGEVSIEGLRRCTSDRHPLVRSAATGSLRYFHSKEVGSPVGYEPGSIREGVSE